MRVTSGTFSGPTQTQPPENLFTGSVCPQIMHRLSALFHFKSHHPSMTPLPPHPPPSLHPTGRRYTVTLTWVLFSWDALSSLGRPIDEIPADLSHIWHFLRSCQNPGIRNPFTSSLRPHIVHCLSALDCLRDHLSPMAFPIPYTFVSLHHTGRRQAVPPPEH